MNNQGFRVGSLWLHRREQWDLGCIPWIAAHWAYDHGNGSRRVLCLWPGGLNIGPLWVRWGKKQ